MRKYEQMCQKCIQIEAWNLIEYNNQYSVIICYKIITKPVLLVIWYGVQTLIYKNVLRITGPLSVENTDHSSHRGRVLRGFDDLFVVIMNKLLNI